MFITFTVAVASVDLILAPADADTDRLVFVDGGISVPLFELFCVTWMVVREVCHALGNGCS